MHDMGMFAMYSASTFLCVGSPKAEGTVHDSVSGTVHCCADTKIREKKEYFRKQKSKSFCMHRGYKGFGCRLACKMCSGHTL